MQPPAVQSIPKENISAEECHRQERGTMNVYYCLNPIFLRKKTFKKVIQIIMDEFNKGQTGNECQKNDAKLSLADYSL